jgi:hypothetical protein
MALELRGLRREELRQRGRHRLELRADGGDELGI